MQCNLQSAFSRHATSTQAKVLFFVLACKLMMFTQIKGRALSCLRASWNCSNKSLLIPFTTAEAINYTQ